MTVRLKNKKTPFEALLELFVNKTNALKGLTAPYVISPRNGSGNSSGKTNVIIFPPHPDDEAITGLLPLRLQREDKQNIKVYPVTLGSKIERQSQRFIELMFACQYLGFGVSNEIVCRELGNIDFDNRQQDPEWLKAVELVGKILNEEKPDLIIYPHELDGNPTHIKTSHLINEALTKFGSKLSLLTAKTEYWHPMTNPNLLLDGSRADVSDLMIALTYHAGEVIRNPYHLSLPAWMIDNVRRGSEMMGTYGGAITPFDYATIYKIEKWNCGEWLPAFDSPSMVSKDGFILGLLNSKA